MHILAEIHRADGVNIHGKTIHRTAVRGIIQHGQNLFMIQSTAVGDYKFPGGGVVKGETHAQALRREIQEECGVTLTHLGGEIGAVIEYNFPIEPEYDVFKMTSHYYRCDVEDGFGAQRLDDYEQDLGFKPVWVNIDEAISTNQSLLISDKIPECLKRELVVLQYIQRSI
jgi:8-oxo-dGTP pyrophosphatase MutT (NUDIX family)